MLENTNTLVAVSNAFAQGAFIFWNHPGWKQPERKAVWYKEQGEFFANGWLHGIEVVNGDDYYTEAHAWAVEKDLAPLANSDAHDPVAFDFDRSSGSLRPMTLLFATERTPEAVREALFAKRTVAFMGNHLYGHSQYLEPLFQRSISIVGPKLRLRAKSTAQVQIRNNSAVTFELRINPKLPELDAADRLTLPAGKTALLQVRCVSERVTGDQVVGLPCKVLNLVPAPGKGLNTTLRIPVEFRN
ncbi:hypothetical protein EG834_21020 [bacterium]|nr:hypothetical protein [bacterium]